MPPGRGDTGRTWEDKRESEVRVRGRLSRTLVLPAWTPCRLGLVLKLRINQKPTSPARTFQRRLPAASFSQEMSDFSACLRLRRLPCVRTLANFARVRSGEESSHSTREHKQRPLSHRLRRAGGASRPSPPNLRTPAAWSYFCNWGESDFWVSSTDWVTLAQSPLRELCSIYKT